VKGIAVLDRTKEPGSVAEPLYLDVAAALEESRSGVRIIGGRYGLSSKEFTPAMVKAVFDELAKQNSRKHFTVGITDDVTKLSLNYDREFHTENPNTTRALFFGLGSDGTVGANKNSIKIIGETPGRHVQGYFVYDSKKAGSVTISHLRFGPQPVRSTYLIQKANFIGCHQFSFLGRMDVLSRAEQGAVLLLNAPFEPSSVWDQLPGAVQQQILAKKLRVYSIDAYKVAQQAGMGNRINTIMQTCFFAISGLMPREDAVAAIKHAIEKSYGKRGEAVLRKNFEAVDHALAHLHKIAIPEHVTSPLNIPPAVAPHAPEMVREVLGTMIAGRGDELPVSALPQDGTFPTGTSRWEKRNLAKEIPVWDEQLCIQCGKCVLVCPHAVIRAKVYEPQLLSGAPSTFKRSKPRWRGLENLTYTLQVAPEDCTGCSLCVEICPVKSKSEAKHKAINMREQAPLRESERENWEFFLSLPEYDRDKLSHTQVKDVQLLEPLFEFSGACAGCGETPYIKLLTQLFGDRLVIANATGCSSIYGGNLPTTPYAKNIQGRGPAWSNSLFEDNAEFGLGMRIANDQQAKYAQALVSQLSVEIGLDLVKALLEADQSKESGIVAQRKRVAELKQRLVALGSEAAQELFAVADSLIHKSVWIVGGDGWAYDIGAGGLDHVLGTGLNVNILVLDTEVYSNTGGQMSKATPRGAVAKFAVGGKRTGKKDLAMEAMSYGNVYVARVAMGGSDTQTVKAFLEAEEHPGPSIIIAYSHCIAHGYDMVFGMNQQKLAVLSGYWPLFRYNPALFREGRNPLQLDSRAPSISLEKYAYQEARYSMLVRSNPEVAKELMREAKEDVGRHWQTYENYAAAPVAKTDSDSPKEAANTVPEAIVSGGEEA
jgi:pyruvate-ferredoxin/flavodoxin oxidoreductase